MSNLPTPIRPNMKPQAQLRLLMVSKEETNIERVTGKVITQPRLKRR